MATVVETLTNTNNLHYRQAISPDYYSGTFVINDTDNHDFVVDTKGKSVITVVMDVSTSDQTVTTTAYGMHSSSATVGDTGVVAIDGGKTKLIIFGQQGVKTAGKPKKGESA